MRYPGSLLDRPQRARKMGCRARLCVSPCPPVGQPILPTASVPVMPSSSAHLSMNSHRLSGARKAGPRLEEAVSFGSFHVPTSWSVDTDREDQHKLFVDCCMPEFVGRRPDDG